MATRNWIFTLGTGSSTLNQSIPAEATTVAQNIAVLYAIKQTLVGFASGAWTVVQSRNGSGTYGAADYWTSKTAITYSTTKPWIVLQTTFGGRTVQLLISNTNQPGSVDGLIYMTTADLFPASVGGAQPVVPATALRVLASGSDTETQLVSVNAAGIVRLHMMQTYDAVQGIESLRWFIFRAGTLYGWIAIEKPINIPTGGTAATYPEVAIGTGSSGMTYAPTWAGALNGYIYTIQGTTRFTSYGSVDCINGGATVPQVNSGQKHARANAFALAPVGIVSQNEALYGKLGQFCDLWLGSNAVASGNNYPASPDPPTLVQFGELVMPWDSTAGAAQLT